ncbi:MAG: GDP-mannose 4,6-dehydratase [Gaiellaceae bacterium]
MRVLVTGGCGFIGTNLVLDRLRRGDFVRVLDNCSRAGTERNLEALRAHESDGHLEILLGDVRDEEVVRYATADVDVVFHLAAQVAVTTSVMNPREDYDINATGSLNVLEAARAAVSPPIVIYTSTNKVYGGLEHAPTRERGGRYEFVSHPEGVPEDVPLDFHSPYGCSKGAADQYVIDYSRIYGLRTVTFRQSCIYGPWQYGNEDQGWIAHFALNALRGEAVTVYGDGKQVRDVLFVDDLIDLYDRALNRIAVAAGKAYNIGGGPGFSISVLQCLEMLEQAVGRQIRVTHGDWRPGDQRVYISDVRRAGELGWCPTTSFSRGLNGLLAWMRQNIAATAVAP